MLCLPPDRSNITKYLHLIRDMKDPIESMPRGKGKRDSTHWRKAWTTESFRNELLKLMRDGVPRTFNRMCVEITGTTADVWFEKEPDAALWELVEERVLWWTFHEGCVYFVHKFAIRSSQCP